MATYKTGDHVRIILNRPPDITIHPCWVSEMDRFLGVEMVIGEVLNDSTYVMQNGNGWKFGDYMIQGLLSEEGDSFEPASKEDLNELWIGRC